MGGKVCLRCRGKTLLGVVIKLLKTKSLLTSHSNVLPYYLKKTFLPIIWIFHWRWRWLDRIQAIVLNLFYFISKFQHIHMISVSIHWMHIVLKVCQTVAGISLTDQFHEFFGIFGGYFDIWPNCTGTHFLLLPDSIHIPAGS